MATVFTALLGLVAAATAQSFFGVGEPQAHLALGLGHKPTYDARTTLFNPLESFDALSSSTYTTLAHPAFPKHQVRIKNSDFCDGTVGYASPQIAARRC